jgi:hypothetical protein
VASAASSTGARWAAAASGRSKVSLLVLHIFFRLSIFLFHAIV